MQSRIFLALAIAGVSRADTCTDELAKLTCVPQSSDCTACTAKAFLKLLEAKCTVEEVAAFCRGPPTPAPAPTPEPPPSGRRPQNPKNLTVVGLRPYELPDLNNKDTADALGDIYFWLTDKVLLPYTCREDPGFLLCNSSGLVADNQVYEQTVLEIDGGDVGQYALCNPETSDPSGHTWECQPSIPQFGAGNVKTMYGNCTIDYHGHDYDICVDRRTGKPVQFMEWRVALAAKLGDGTSGNWYSTQTKGNCDDEGQQCYWRVVENVKIANATCVNSRIVNLVESSDKDCFAKCDDKAALGDCYTTCFMEAILGNNSTQAPIPTATILGIFNDAFSSDDVSKGGCPSLPPWVPPTTKM